MPKKHDIYKKDVKASFASRLQQMAKLWMKKNETVLKHQQKLLKLWASGFYEDGYSRDHLINLIDRGIYSIVPYLVEGNPKIMVETLIGNYRPWAYITQLSLNFLINKMSLADRVFIPAAINSMFGAGITRTFTEYDRTINLENEVIKTGTPSIKIIHDSSYIGDPIARNRDDFIFEGDIYKLPTEYAKDLFAGKDKFGNEIADYILPDCKLISDFSPENISNPNKISQPNYNSSKFALRDYTTFIDLYMYDTNHTITIMPEGKKAKILREVEEEGPKESPYDYLGYKFFPESPVPIPPAWFWHDLDVSLNIVAKTAREQAESQRDLVVAPPAARKGLENITNAKNMDVLIANDSENITQLSFGGMNKENFNWMNFVDVQFNKAGGTAEIMSGRGADAPTLGQEKMQFANASRIVNNMYTRWHEFMTSIIRKLAWRVWTDPTVYIPVVHEIPGVENLPKVFSQADKVGDFYDFVFNLIPYSSQRTSPEAKYQTIMSFMAQWVLPTYQFAAQQGAELDVPAVTQIMSDLLGIDNFNQFYKTALPHELEGIGYTMQPVGGERKKGEERLNIFGQQNDSFGA
ncbi:MAG: hypothetical protein E3J77_04925, partial [Actinobacteria bacterium]